MVTSQCKSQTGPKNIYSKPILYILLYIFMHFMTIFNPKPIHYPTSLPLSLTPPTYPSGLSTRISGVSAVAPLHEGSPEMAQRLFLSLDCTPDGFPTVEFSTALHFSSSIRSFSMSSSFSSSSVSSSSISLSLWFNSSILFLRANWRSRSVPILSSFLRWGNQTTEIVPQMLF